MQRRDVIKNIGVAALAAGLPKFAMSAEKKNAGKLKVGLIGCSGRGLGAVKDMINAAGNDVQFVALADLFPDRLARGVKRLEAYKSEFKDKYGDELVDIPASRQFVGWDAYKQLIAEDVDIVMHATPPAFRPLHLRAAVDAGKNIFVEKPACVDAPGARELLKIADDADKKGLSIIPGVQRRFHKGYQEAVKRVQDGQIGEILAAQAYWLNSRFFIQKFDETVKDPQQLEYQIRNWFIFRWISGDCYVEQHVHSLDVINWVMNGKTPKEVCGIGGRRWDLPVPEMGDRFSHFGIDFDYGNGLHLASYSRREPKSGDYVLERVIGTKGVLETSMESQKIIGENSWTAPKDLPQCLEEEHRVLVDAVKSGKPVNMLREMVGSTVMAIAGREAAYCGQRFKFDWILKRSQQSLLPKEWKFGVFPVAGVPLPGEYKLS